MKQVLKKFATIIEEAETASLAPKLTPPASEGGTTPSEKTAELKDLEVPHESTIVNGTSHTPRISTESR